MSGWETGRWAAGTSPLPFRLLPAGSSDVLLRGS